MSSSHIFHPSAGVVSRISRGCIAERKYAVFKFGVSGLWLFLCNQSAFLYEKPGTLQRYGPMQHGDSKISSALIILSTKNGSILRKISGTPQAFMDAAP